MFFLKKYNNNLTLYFYSFFFIFHNFSYKPCTNVNHIFLIVLCVQFVIQFSPIQCGVAVINAEVKNPERQMRTIVRIQISTYKMNDNPK